MSDVKLSMGTLYEVNQQAIDALPKMSEQAINEKSTELEKYIYLGHAKYYMLLCNEYKYYTVFVNSTPDKVPELVKVMVEECMKPLGDIIGIDYQKDNNAYEVWIRTSDDKVNHAFYFFPCDGLVVEV